MKAEQSAPVSLSGRYKFTNAMRLARVSKAESQDAIVNLNEVASPVLV